MLQLLPVENEQLTFLDSDWYINMRYTDVAQCFSV